MNKTDEVSVLFFSIFSYLFFKFYYPFNFETDPFIEKESDILKIKSILSSRRLYSSYLLLCFGSYFCRFTDFFYSYFLIFYYLDKWTSIPIDFLRIKFAPFTLFEIKGLLNYFIDMEDYWIVGIYAGWTKRLINLDGSWTFYMFYFFNCKLMLFYCAYLILYFL